MLAFGTLFIHTLSSYPRGVKVGISQDQNVVTSDPPPPAQDTSSHPSNPASHPSLTPPKFESV